MEFQAQLDALRDCLDEIAMNTQIIAEVLCDVYGYEVAECEVCGEDEADEVVVEDAI